VEENGKFSKLREQQREKRKNLIIDAAEMVFMKKPFNEVSMRNIAREAGITPTAIYRYFPDKQILFCEAYQRDAQRLLKVVIDSIGHGEELRLGEIAMHYVNFFWKNSQALKILANFTVDDSYSDDCSIIVNLSTRPIVDQVERHIKKFSPDIDARVLARSFFAAINGALISYRKYPGKSEDEIWKHLNVIIGVISRIFTDYIIRNPKEAAH
jgi:AcrR family transcriptional regulator